MLVPDRDQAYEHTGRVLHPNPRLICWRARVS